LNKIPLTILSRCQHLNFRRISVLEIVRQLENIIKAESINVDKDVIYAVARSSDGSLRDAESILDQLVSFSKERISIKDVVSILGLVEQEALFEITQAIIDKNPKAALNLLDRLIDDGKDATVFLQDLIAHFRNLMVAKITQADAKLIDLPEDICKKLLEQSRSLSLEEVFAAFNILVVTQEMAKRFDSIRIPLEITLVKLSYDKKVSPAQTSVNKEIHVSVPAHIKHEAPKIIQKKEPHKIVDEGVTQEVPGAVVYLDDAKRLWQNAIEVLSKIKISVASYLGEGTPVKLEKNTLIISFPKNYSLHKESMETKENKPLIEKAFSDVLNANLKVNFILAKEESVRNDITHHPAVKSALEMFNGRVIKEE
ncbi:MAG: hypothetical protein NT033_01270, partial [Candidatus Omnitrophica bacterium]|nr:hypothetical protein [Candidatus Omnitrophota bacterium]